MYLLLIIQIVSQCYNQIKLKNVLSKSYEFIMRKALFNVGPGLYCS